MTSIDAVATIPTDRPVLAVRDGDTLHHARSESEPVVTYNWVEHVDQVISEDEDRVTRDVLAFAGAWADLDEDWEKTAEALYRIRHSNPPSPPIDFDFDES